MSAVSTALPTSQGEHTAPACTFVVLDASANTAGGAVKEEEVMCDSVAAFLLGGSEDFQRTTRRPTTRVMRCDEVK